MERLKAAISQSRIYMRTEMVSRSWTFENKWGQGNESVVARRKV